jgi:hypothetical protein
MIACRALQERKQIEAVDAAVVVTLSAVHRRKAELQHLPAYITLPVIVAPRKGRTVARSAAKNGW